MGGTAYAPGATVTMPGHALILHAIWEDTPGSGDGSSSKAEDSNGGSPSSKPRDSNGGSPSSKPEGGSSGSKPGDSSSSAVSRGAAHLAAERAPHPRHPGIRVPVPKTTPCAWVTGSPLLPPRQPERQHRLGVG